jgi:DNA-directed RNA polymerase subunit E'/Rpb7
METKIDDNNEPQEMKQEIQELHNDEIQINIIDKEGENTMKLNNNQNNKQTNNNKKNILIKSENIYSRGLLTRRIDIPITSIGKNFRETIENILKKQLEGKCITEGFVKNNSVKVITYSSGIVKTNSIQYEVVFECLICFLVEGMIIPCVIQNITKAGLRCESSDETPSPFILFLSKDHHNNNKKFNSLKENDKIFVRVIGQRFELNDKYIYAIGQLANNSSYI